MPDEEVLGLEPLELRPRRREAQHEVHACAIVSGAEEPVGADRLGDDERSLVAPPERDVRASGAWRARRRLERRARQRRPASRDGARRAPPRARRSRGCDGRGAGARPPARRACVPASARARGAPGRRARHARPRRARVTCASSARRRATRSPLRPGRRRSGSPRRRAYGRRRRCGRVDAACPRPQPPPGALPCPWCHASDDRVPEVRRERADRASTRAAHRSGAGVAVCCSPATAVARNCPSRPAR